MTSISYHIPPYVKSFCSQVYQYDYVDFSDRVMPLFLRAIALTKQGSAAPAVWNCSLLGIEYWKKLNRKQNFKELVKLASVTSTLAFLIFDFEKAGKPAWICVGIVVNLSQGKKHLSNGEYWRYLKTICNLAGNVIHLAAWATSAPELKIAAQTVQFFQDTYKAYTYLDKKDKLVELWTHTIFATIYAYQLDASIKFLPQKQ